MIELRKLAPDDAEARYYTRDAAASARQDPRTPYMLGLVGDGDLLGVVKLHRDRPIATISYILRADAWGRGHATEGVRRILALGIGHLGLPKIHARHHPDNPASGRVLLKAGFVLTGVSEFMTYAFRPPGIAGRAPPHLTNNRSTPWNRPSDHRQACAGGPP
ncbi:GNAT family N-acetyltransferase [Kitasatospora sp. NBC_00458]|uniref:GNAT family N-acetyltransferase n=1 Tax=Kitasatospora sp. NBC_00458 TaxID=2903568 RepID=UPI002E18D018